MSETKAKDTSNMVELEWKAFILSCFGKELSSVSKNQYFQMRRTFYAGAAIVFGMLTNQISEGSEAKQEDLDMLTNIQIELMNFADACKRGEK